MLSMDQIYPNVAYLCRGKTRKSTPGDAARSLGQVEAYLTVRECLSEASIAADGVLSCERSNFYRCRYTTLGYITSWVGRNCLELAMNEKSSESELMN
jgi:hypothetical protein